MGIFSPKSKQAYSPSPVRKADVAPIGEQEKTPGLDEADDQDAGEKKTYAKEKANPAAKVKELEPDSVTSLNTKRNALLYHTSDDSIDLYRTQNNSSDLLGRLYYDDYDPDNRQIAERISSFNSLSSLSKHQPPSIMEKLDTGSTANSNAELLPAQRPSRRPSFSRQVSFDTLNDTHHSSITLKVKHPDFRFRRNNKTFLIGFSNDSESLKAVEWVFLEMAIHGDTIIVFQVLDAKSYQFVDPLTAESVLEKLKKLNTHRRRISLVYEVVIGNPQNLLKSAIKEYQPAMMVVGTRQYGQALTINSSSSSSLSQLNQTGPSVHNSPQTHLHPSSYSHSKYRSFFSKASVSNYFLQYALVPVIMVKPFYEIHETLDKPIDSENYFRDWLANIDISHTREKKKKHMFGFMSPTSSKNSSFTSLTDLRASHEPGDKHNDELQETLQLASGERRQTKHYEKRGRSEENAFSFSIGGNQVSSSSKQAAVPAETLATESRSGSRSRSKSRTTLSRLFSA